jgi:hypothetical protein
MFQLNTYGARKKDFLEIITHKTARNKKKDNS